MRLNLICVVAAAAAAAASKSRGFDIHLCARSYTGINTVLSLLRLIVPPLFKLHYVQYIKGQKAFVFRLSFCLICSYDYQLVLWQPVFSWCAPSRTELLLGSFNLQTVLLYLIYLWILANKLEREQTTWET